MKPKVIVKLIIDIAMTVIFLILMAYRAIGNNTVHELFGVSLFVLFILHHILNLKYCRTIEKMHIEANVNEDGYSVSQ